MAKKQTKRQPLDNELLRMQGILRVIEDLDMRLWKLRRDIGEGAYDRALAYFKKRSDWTFRRFNNNQPLQ